MATIEERIKTHLDQFATEDAAFAAKYANKKKSIEGCVKYITSQARERAKGAGSIGIEDEVVYGWAIHYYDEDESEAAPEPQATTATPEPQAAKAAPKADRKVAQKRKVVIKHEAVQKVASTPAPQVAPTPAPQTDPENAPAVEHNLSFDDFFDF